MEQLESGSREFETSPGFGRCLLIRCVVVVVVVVVVAIVLLSSTSPLILSHPVCSAQGEAYTRFLLSAINVVFASQGRLLSRDPDLAWFNRSIVESTSSSTPIALYITTRNKPVKQEKSWKRLQTHMRQRRRCPRPTLLNLSKHKHRQRHNSPISSLLPQPRIPSLLKSQTALKSNHNRNLYPRVPILCRRHPSTCPLLLSSAPRQPSL